ncbi:MAG: hypothetical protein IJ302_09970, partial [Clostridia bacterium]|nr:hypothetical protein [Clostridia bacterium]
GGTKVLALLYDDNFRMISTHRTGSLRSNTTPPDMVARNIESLISEMDIAGKTVGCITGIPDGGLVSRIREVCTVENTATCGEMQLGLHAAELFGDGILALSGTGATMFANWEGRHYATGGYGAAVSDAGSGYWIGRAAFNAAIEDDEGRGPRTVLTDLLAEKLGGSRDNFGAAIFAIYGQNLVSPTAYVASCTPLVSRAAMSGDAAAMRILERAGYLIGAQTVAMVRKHRLPRTLPVTISGSVWRSHPLLFDTFRDTLSAASMEGNLHIPAFEPIVGAVIGHYYRLHGKFDADDRAYFAEQFAPHAFEVSSDLRHRPNPQKIVPTVRADAPVGTAADTVIDL